MEPIRSFRGRMAPLDRTDVDTDQIMAKQHLKKVDRVGFGEVVFEEWRKDPGFVLNDPRFAGATVLLSGENFGAGSSREHAVWGLQQYGFRAIISPRFADIFHNNADRAGLLAIELPTNTVRDLMELAIANPETELLVDIPNQRVQAGDIGANFRLNEYTREALTNGLDFIDMTLRKSDEIVHYESSRSADLPKIV